jgi:hypothetical protein
MNIKSTKLPLTKPLQALPASSPAAPGIIVLGSPRSDEDNRLGASAQTGLDTGPWRSAIALDPRSSAFSLLGEALNHPMVDLAKTVSDILRPSLPDGMQRIVKGMWYVVAIGKSAAAISEQMQKEPDEHDLGDILLATADATVSSFGLTAAIADQPGLADVQASLGLLVGSTRAVQKGHDLTYYLLNEHLRKQSPEFKLADNAAKLAEAALSLDPNTAGIKLRPLMLAMDNPADTWTGISSRMLFSSRVPGSPP